MPFPSGADVVVTRRRHFSLPPIRAPGRARPPSGITHRAVSQRQMKHPDENAHAVGNSDEWGNLNPSSELRVLDDEKVAANFGACIQKSKYLYCYGGESRGTRGASTPVPVLPLSQSQDVVISGNKCTSATTQLAYLRLDSGPLMDARWWSSWLQ